MSQWPLVSLTLRPPNIKDYGQWYCEQDRDENAHQQRKHRIHLLVRAGRAEKNEGPICFPEQECEDGYPLSRQLHDCIISPLRNVRNVGVSGQSASDSQLLL